MLKHAAPVILDTGYTDVGYRACCDRFRQAEQSKATAPSTPCPCQDTVAAVALLLDNSVSAGPGLCPELQALCPMSRITNFTLYHIISCSQHQLTSARTLAISGTAQPNLQHSQSLPDHLGTPPCQHTCKGWLITHSMLVAASSTLQQGMHGLVVVCSAILAGDVVILVRGRPQS